MGVYTPTTSKPQGFQQRRIMAIIERDGVFTASTPAERKSALSLHDRGLLDRGEDSLTYHPKGHANGS